MTVEVVHPVLRDNIDPARPPHQEDHTFVAMRPSRAEARDDRTQRVVAAVGPNLLHHRGQCAEREEDLQPSQLLNRSRDLRGVTHAIVGRPWPSRQHVGSKVFLRVDRDTARVEPHPVERSRALSSHVLDRLRVDLERVLEVARDGLPEVGEDQWLRRQEQHELCATRGRERWDRRDVGEIERPVVVAILHEELVDLSSWVDQLQRSGRECPLSLHGDTS